MCIIIAKKAGLVLPKKEILQNCFTNNPDGAGFMFTHKDKTIIKKGYTDFKTFYHDLIKYNFRYNLKYKNVVLHFRIATHGGVTPAKTHPFLLTDDVDVLNSIDVKAAAPGVAHNGVLYNYTNNKQLSDSQNFIKDFLFKIYSIDKKFYNNNNFNDIILQVIGAANKLAIIDGHELHTYGHFIEDGGVLYSNDSYKVKKTYTPVYYKKYNNYNTYSIYNDYNYYMDY